MCGHPFKFAAFSTSEHATEHVRTCGHGREMLDSYYARATQESKSMAADKHATNTPCKYGHVAARRKDNGSCMECNRIRAKRYRLEKAGHYKRVELSVPRQYADDLARVAALPETEGELLAVRLPKSLVPHLKQIIADMGGKA